MFKGDITHITNRELDEAEQVESATLTIEQLFGYGYVKFRSPLKISVLIYHKEQLAIYEYDFGMEDKVSVDPKKNYLVKYRDRNNPSTDPVKTVLNTVLYDIEHAFFHYEGDPNYTHTHWALRGHLSDRIEELAEWWDVDEIANEEQLTFKFNEN